MPAKDIRGKKFGMLTAVSPTKKRTAAGSIVWKYKCQCGNFHYSRIRGRSDVDIHSCESCRKKRMVKRGKIQGGRNKKPMDGKRFGILTVLRETGHVNKNCMTYKCLCDCGNIAVVDGHYLRNGATKSCGCLLAEHRARMGRDHFEDLTGHIFGRLTVIQETNLRRRSSVIWECECICGDRTIVPAAALKNGSTKSCGCFRDATQFVKHTTIDPMDVPFVITDTMKARRELKKAIKQAS